MPARSLNFRWAPRASLLAALLPLLADCGPSRNQFAPPCPSHVILGDAADLDLYRQSNAPGGPYDLTDLVLHARVVGMNGTCKEGDKKSQLAVTVNVGVELTRGPAMAGREADVPVFVAVTDGDTIIDKRTYTMRMAFPSNVDRITLSPGELSMVLPVSTTKTGAAYTIVAGFQLTPEQIMQNRRSRRP